MNRRAFVDATSIVVELVGRPEVADNWSRESACAGMTVGGLAHHLVGQADSTVRFLEDEPGDQAPIPLLEHYARAAWVNSGPDSEANRDIRETADSNAGIGPDGLLAMARQAFSQLPGVLERRRDPDIVHVAWQGWSLTTDDWLVTRLMETVVHSDDLAVSIGVPTPEFPDDALRPVLDLLTALSVRRHGQAALIRTLARAERAPDSVAAF